LAAVGRQRGVILQRRPDLRRGLKDVLEGHGHDSDDRVEIAIERDLCADDTWVRAKAPLPQAVAQDRNLGAVKAIILGLKSTPDPGSDAQCGEVSGRNALAIET